jgi:hypothetical protein
MSELPSPRAITQPIEMAAHRAAPWVVHLARVGYVADALLYATIGILAALAALHRGGETTGATGALATILRAPLGDVLLYICAVGFAGYAVWRVVAAITDAEGLGRGLKGMVGRVAGAIVGLVYGGLAVTAFRLAARRGGAGGSDRLAATLLHLPAGEWLTWIASLSLVGYGVYQVHCAWTSQLDRQLDLGAMVGGTGRSVIPLCRAGIAARGVVLGVIGLLLVRAVTHRDPGAAGGIRESLEALGRSGQWVLGLVALGLVAYAIYQLLNARYRRIP